MGIYTMSKRKYELFRYFSFVSYFLFMLSHLDKSLVSSHPQNPMQPADFTCRIPYE